MIVVVIRSGIKSQRHRRQRHCGYVCQSTCPELNPCAKLSFHRVWSSSQATAGVAAKNLRLVHAPSDYFYLVSDASLPRKTVFS
jgi:hypothetical protein